MSTSTSETTAPTTNNLHTVLLALKRLRRPRPDHILPHLRNPKDPSDFDYLDALATLCAFAGPCDSVSTAVRCSPSLEGNDLYIATSSPPPDPPALQAQLAAWTDLMRTLPVRRRVDSDSDSDVSEDGSESEEPGSPESEEGSGSEEDSESKEGPESEFEDHEYATSTQSFIVEVYRGCHAKLLDIINRDDVGQKVLERVETMPERYIVLYGISRPQLAGYLKCLVALARKKLLTSAEDLLSLYSTAKAVAEFERPLYRLECVSFLRALSDLTLAVDTLVDFATHRKMQDIVQSPWNFIWVHVPGPESARDFVATTNVDELAAIVPSKWRDALTSPTIEWRDFHPTPSGNVQQVEESPGHFTGKGVVHCESALLAYLHANQLYEDKAIQPYIGCSRPVCYACLTLIRAHYWELYTRRIDVGRRSDLEEIDVSWAYPRGMGPAVYKRLVADMVGDFKLLVRNPYKDVFHHIVTDPSGLPEGF
ncbi:hypothetical protein GSI_11165 [Ganoderma sinense ZZ0214-1]|uniref:Uncharacterized protein n=1 Tax=Ganoderma sinense ZZ0214-1 TaxID=1077348 RepID=A0A2G8RZ04_9APHY|nr:hypothetical protein GSI_11165 [Ganoderma sinense ZZ0214-1]